MTIEAELSRTSSSTHGKCYKNKNDRCKKEREKEVRERTKNTYIQQHELSEYIEGVYVLKNNNNASAVALA
jgi:hypothetical protein